MGLDLSAFTYPRRPVKIVRVEHFYDINQAIAREKQLKGWSHAKKEALIKEDFDRVYEISNEKNRREKIKDK